MSHGHFIRVPPDSSGKRILHKVLFVVEYTNKTQNITVGDTVVLETSLVEGTVSKIYEETVSSGVLEIVLEEESAELAVGGENIKILGTTVAQTSNVGEAFFAQQNILVGANNPEFGQSVNQYGASSVTFSEGQPTLDAVGNLRISEMSVIGAYDFASGPQDSLFTDTTIGSSSVVYQAQPSLMKLSVDNASGSFAGRTTDRYHYYLPGTSNLTLTHVICGDNGKLGNIREWGLFDESNGISFLLSGTQLCVNLRNDSSGVVTNELIPQSEWNGDRCNGLGLSKFNLVPSSRNLFWFDFLWLGAGSIRCGVFSSRGQRIVCHTFENIGDQVSFPWASRASLPITVRNYNVSSTVSTTELFYVTSAIYTEGKNDYIFWRYADLENSALIDVTGSNTPVLSVRSKFTNNGKTNRVNCYPQKLNVYVEGGPVKLSWHEDVELTGSTWTITSESTMEGDEGATSVTSPPPGALMSEFAAAGVHTIDLESHYETNDAGIGLTADGSQWVASLLATPLSGSSVKVRAALTHRELS